jgi:hypothetical protein
VGVLSIGVDGGATTTLAGDPGTTNSGLWAITADATSVYWGELTSGTVMSMPIGGGTPATLASGQSPGELVLDDNNIYWVGGDNSIVRAPIAGGAPITLATLPLTVAALAVDATSVYVIDGAGLQKVTPK